MRLKPIHRVVATVATAATFCNLALDSTPVAACEEYAISLWDSLWLFVDNVEYRWKQRREAKQNPPLYVSLDRMNNR